MRPLHYAIVDEVDSILIDECRNPLMITGAATVPLWRFPIAAKVTKRRPTYETYTWFQVSGAALEILHRRQCEIWSTAANVRENPGW